MLRTIALLATLLLSAPALASGAQQKFSTGPAIVATALSAASTSFTQIFDAPSQQGIWGLMTAFICITDADNSTTAINMSCTGSPDRGTTDYTLQDCSSVTGGVCTSANASWTKNPAAIASPKCWPWRVDIEGLPEIECTFTDTGGAAADTIAVTVTFATKGS